MPKNERQKLKLLYLARILMTQTDDAHPLTMPELLAALSEYGIAAERKSIYDDIAALRDFGMDIEKTSARTPGYYVASRALELPELKEMVSLLRYSSNNLNQLTKRVHETGRIYDADLEDLRQSHERLWDAARDILSALAKLN